jgi:hypothetical protein
VRKNNLTPNSVRAVGQTGRRSGFDPSSRCRAAKKKGRRTAALEMSEWREGRHRQGRSADVMDQQTTCQHWRLARRRICFVARGDFYASVDSGRDARRPVRGVSIVRSTRGAARRMSACTQRFGRTHGCFDARVGAMRPAIGLSGRDCAGTSLARARLLIAIVRHDSSFAADVTRLCAPAPELALLRPRACGSARSLARSATNAACASS